MAVNTDTQSRGTAPPAGIEESDHPCGVRRILLRDPLERNPINPALRTELARALQAALDDGTVRAIVIGSAGRNFSVGGDLAEIDGYAGGQSSHARMRGVGDLVRLVGECSKPLVAAVTGHCLGAGAGLALLCDTLIAGHSARIGFPFLKIGLGPDFGVSWTLSRRIGSAAAARALLQARTFTADEALSCGLVDEIVEDGSVPERALAIATELAALPAYAYGLTKDMLRQPGRTLDAALKEEALVQSICFASPDMREGVAAFREKRPARFVPDVAPPGGTPRK